MPQAIPLRFCPDSTLPDVKSWRGSWGAPCLERGRARHCCDAMATRAGKAVGDFTARRRSAKVRLGKTSVEEARFQEAHRVHNAPEDTHERLRGPHAVCASNAPSGTRAL